MVLFVIVLCLNVWTALVATADPKQHPNALKLAEGEKQYQIIQSNTNLPLYGKCWTEAIIQIDTTCNDLNEMTQGTLALQFTKCFMAMSGGDAELDQCNDIDCIGNMSERVFQSYTHFYTHTQNICFYLMNQIWHSETERTVQSLRTHSKSVSRQLELAGRLQINLLQQQREGLKVQRQLVEHGLNLSEVLNESQGSLGRLTEQFRNSTIEQGRQLGDLFQRLAQFHNWIVGEYTQIEQIMYYFILLLVIMIATTAKRSQHSRFLLFLVAVANLVVESLFLHYFTGDHFVEDLQIVLYENLWLIRKIFAAIMICVYVGVTVSYIDSQQMTLKLLEKVHRQNTEILQLLRNLNTEPIAGSNDQNRWIDNRVNMVRQSIGREDFVKRMSPQPFIDAYSNTRAMSVLRECSVESIMEPNAGIVTRSRSRRPTPAF